MGERLKVAKEYKLGLSMAALASAYNGIIGSPLFTAVLATEFQVGGKELGLAFLAWNLLAGVIGYFFFTLLGIPSLRIYPLYAHQHADTLVCPLCHLARPGWGAADAVHRGEFPGLRQGDGEIRRQGRPANPCSGSGHRHCGLFLPGGDVLRRVADPLDYPNPTQYGVLMLLLFALLKILLLGLSFKSGYLGGPTFPTLFACTMVGLALSLLFPAIPVSILVLCIESAAVGLLLGAPLTAILLVTVVGTADPYMIALMCLSTVTAMFVGFGVKRLMARRAAGQAAATPATE